jgi:hypothetical protein
MTETVHTYEIYRYDNEGFTHSYEEVFADRKTAESIADALNAVLAHDTYQDTTEKWTVAEYTINHEVAKYVPVFVRTVITNRFSIPSNKVEFSTLNEGYPVKEGTELPATQFSDDFLVARVCGFTFEEATANGEKAMETMKARKEALASK